jgi:hypothetical protein
MRQLPPDVLASTENLVRVSRQMLQELGREATPSELAARLNSPIHEVRRWLRIAKEGADPGKHAAEWGKGLRFSEAIWGSQYVRVYVSSLPYAASQRRRRDYVLS